MLRLTAVCAGAGNVVETNPAGPDGRKRIGTQKVKYSYHDRHGELKVMEKVLENESENIRPMTASEHDGSMLRGRV